MAHPSHRGVKQAEADRVALYALPSIAGGRTQAGDETPEVGNQC